MGALAARGYLVDGREVMSGGAYLYCYELWKDGIYQGRKQRGSISK